MNVEEPRPRKRGPLIRVYETAVAGSSRKECSIPRDLATRSYWTFFDAYLKACLKFIWEACTANYYPYVRIYAHADGSYHSSGNDW